MSGRPWNRLANPTASLPEFPDSTRLRYALGGSLLLLVAVRLLPVLDIYQNGAVVFSSNDPYAYRYAVGQLLQDGRWPWALPDSVANGEPLFVTTLWAASLLLGGGRLATDTVVAWYPVLSALLTGYLVYAIAVRASGDPRLGLAAVLLFAATPAHAFRSGLGFADHHAFDYLWLTLTVYALVAIVTHEGRHRSDTLAVALLGIGVGGQLLAWEAGPLLLVPLAIAVTVVSPALAGGRDLSPLGAIALGVGIGSAVTVLGHYGLGWHERPVVLAALATVVGCLGVLALAWGCRRIGRSWPVMIVLEAVTLLVGFAVVSAVAPELLDALDRGVELLLRDSRIGEMSSLISDYGVVFGPLIILGFAPFLALPGVVSSLWRSWRHANLAWPVLAVYAVYFTVLTMTQVRFGGHLAPFLAVFGGVGLIGLLAKLDLVRSRTWTTQDSSPDRSIAVPDRTRLLLMGGIAGVFTGTGTLYSTLINARISIDPRAVRAAQWMRGYADERAWTYPDNFVLSKWGRNRMFNYFVNGESNSYGYAQRNYEDFLFSSNAQGWYEEFLDRVGFVVVRDFDHLDIDNPLLMYTRLLRFGTATGGSPGLGHYRAVYASSDHKYVVFTLVTGATVTGTVEGTTEISTDVSIPGAEFEYARTVDPDDDGSFSATVAQPGTYRLGDRQVEVTEEAVRKGETVAIG